MVYFGNECGGKAALEQHHREQAKAKRICRRTLRAAGSTFDALWFCKKPLSISASWPWQNEAIRWFNNCGRLCGPNHCDYGRSTRGHAHFYTQFTYENVVPPSQTVLEILSEIFRVPEPRIFEDMVLEHLLILREQLSPFYIELHSVERQLDFSDAGKVVARYLANRDRRVLFPRAATTPRL
jgi:hypothetical protein